MTEHHEKTPDPVTTEPNQAGRGWFATLPTWGKVLFILVWPVALAYGLYWMWKQQRFSQGVRIALTAAAGLMVLMVVINGLTDTEPASTTPSSPETPVASDEPPATELPDYRVVSVEDLTFGSVKRYDYHVVVSTEASQSELEAIASEVIAQAQEETPFNAVSVGLYDYEEYMGYGYTLGKVTLAPEGDWAKADQANTGDYSGMSLKSEARDVDWSKRLTQAEVEVWRAWKDEYMVRAEAVDPEDLDDTVDEDLLSSDIADQYDMTADEVSAILTKQLDWQF